MKIYFQKDSGELYAMSPEFPLSKDLAEELHLFAANEWVEVPEVEGGDDDLVMWLDTSYEPFNFQKYIDDMNLFLGINIPKFDEWGVPLILSN